MIHEYFPEIDGPQSRIEAGGKRILCKGGGGGTSTTTQSIPDELKPLATAYTNKAMDLGDQSYNPYGGQRYADLNPTQMAGVGATVDRAQNGSPVMDTANSALTGMMGDNTNPYLDQMYGQAADQVSSRVNSTFSGAGRYGSGAHAQALTEGLGDMATQMYGGAYNTNQGNKLQALGMAQSYGNQDYTDASQLLNAGQVLQDQNQNNLDFGYQQYQDAENDPYKKLAAMSGVFGSNLGSGSTTQQTGGGK